MKKIGIVSQVRMTSTRLPGKVLLPVNDQPLLKYHTDRLQQSNYPVYLATTTNQTDDIIADFATNENLGFYRGDENNVLSRFYETAQLNELEIIVRVTADCPLVDGKIIGQAIKQYAQMANDNVYLSNTIIRTYPRGLDFEIFSFKLLQEAFKRARNTFQLEHVTPYIKDHAQLEHIIHSQDASNFRITVDTPEDLELIKILITEYRANTLTGEDIVKLLRDHPALTKINAHIEQKKT